MLLLFPIPLEQESLHQVHLTFPRNSLTHQALLFIQLSQGNAPAVQKMSRRSKERAGTATRGLLATDHVILNHGQVTWTTPELAPPLLTTTPHQREDVSALDRFNVHRCPTRRVFSGTGLEPVTKQATVRYLYHSATAATSPFVNNASIKIIFCLYIAQTSGQRLN
ncbi:uncharacterized protein TNCV_1099691 [Trichonephila clavipes]|nr:uncharacterized protein TNCV_1099691 [Trichonephila clavipes]